MLLRQFLDRDGNSFPGAGQGTDRQQDARSRPWSSPSSSGGHPSCPGDSLLFSNRFFSIPSVNLALSDLRKALFSHLVEMPMTFFSQRQVGELTSRMFADLTQLQDAFVMTIPQFGRQSIVMLGSMVMMFYISPSLTGVMLGCFPPTIIGAIIIGRMVGKRSRSTHGGPIGPGGQRRLRSFSRHRQCEGFLQRGFRAKALRIPIDDFPQVRPAGSPGPRSLGRLYHLRGLHCDHHCSLVWDHPSSRWLAQGRRSLWVYFLHDLHRRIAGQLCRSLWQPPGSVRSGPPNVFA